MVTAVPFPTSEEKVAACQLDRRMQPWLPARPMVSGRAAVDSDAGAVQSGPEDADGVVGDEGKVVEVLGALPAPGDAEIAAEPWE